MSKNPKNPPIVDYAPAARHTRFRIAASPRVISLSLAALCFFVLSMALPVSTNRGALSSPRHIYGIQMAAGSLPALPRLVRDGEYIPLVLGLIAPAQNLLFVIAWGTLFCGVALPMCGRWAPDMAEFLGSVGLGGSVLLSALLWVGTKWSSSWGPGTTSVSIAVPLWVIAYLLLYMASVFAVRDAVAAKVRQRVEDKTIVISDDDQARVS